MSGKVGSRAFQNARLQKQFRKEADVLLPAAIAAYRAGKQAETQALCRRIVETLPDHFDAQHLLGVSSLDSSLFAEAEMALSRAVGVDPRSAEANSNLGLACFKLKRFEDARKCQEKAIALQPNFPTALTNLGNTLMRLRLTEQAVAAHDRGHSPQARLQRRLCQSRHGAAVAQPQRRGRPGVSIARSRLRPRHLQAVAGKGLVSLNLRHFEAAEAAFNAALAIKPDLAEVLAHRGRLYTQMGRLGQADADFDAALAIDRVLESGWRGKAQIGILSGNVARAIAACKKVLEQNPASEIAITLLGGCYAKQGDIDNGDRALRPRAGHQARTTKRR